MRRPLPSHAPHHLHHPRQIGLAHGGAGGQAQPIAEQRLGHTSPLPRREGPGEGHLAPLKDRLQVHRLPQRPRLDVLPLQRQADALTVIWQASGKRQVIGRGIQVAATQRLRRSIPAQVAQATHVNR